MKLPADSAVVSCERAAVTKLVVREGAGLAPADPVRHVVYVFEDDGLCIARNDPNEHDG